MGQGQGQGAGGGSMWGNRWKQHSCFCRLYLITWAQDERIEEKIVKFFVTVTMEAVARKEKRLEFPELEGVGGGSGWGWGRDYVNAAFFAMYLSFFWAILENLMSMGCVVS